MFESEVGVADLDAAATALLVSEQHRIRTVAECRLLELAAHWAYVHSGPVQPAAQGVASERLRTPGGEGTPAMLEFAAAELGAQLETTTNGAWELIGDALDLRHRLPRLWAAVRAGRVRVWKARRVAHATRHLSLSAAAELDRAIDGLISSLSWSRFESVLDAKIVEADPAGEEARAAAWEAARFVRGGRATEHGLRMVVARAAAGDVAWFLATVDRIAEILAAEGDRELVDVRRSKAIGILARPAHALDLLRRHARGAGEPSRRPESKPATDPDSDVPSQPDPGPGPEPDPEADGHISLDLGDGLIVDPEAARPRVELVVHLAAEAFVRGGGPVRMEGIGPATLGQVRRWLTGADCRISVRPVIDLSAELTPVDAYEIPAALRRLVGLRMPASAFPYSPATAPVNQSGLDLDHTAPYVAMDRGGPPGQTRLGNLGPLSRGEHRLKTHGGWHVRQPEPGVFVWRSPTGYHWLTSPNAGTYPLGNGRLGQGIWRALKLGLFDLAA